MSDYNNYDYETERYNYVKPKKKSNKGIIVLCLIFSLIGGVVGSVITFGVMEEKYQFSSAQSPVQNAEGQNINITPKDNSLTTTNAVAKKAMPSIVGITTTQLRDTMWYGQIESQASGSGIIVDERGYILTNAHVVNNGDVKQVSVMLDDGTSVDGTVIWSSQVIDVAIVKIETNQKLKVATLGDSDTLEIGDLAIAIGNPIDPSFQRSVTQGIISGLNRVVGQVSGGGYMSGLIQTDASINPGNSGGALLNSKGEVIGVNTVKVNSAEGLGFSIPINSIKPILKQVVETGDYQVVAIEASVAPVEDASRIMNKRLNDTGIFIIETMEGGAAAEAGIQPGDVLVKIDDKDITTVSSLRAALYSYKIGDTAKVKVIRNGEEVTLDLTFKNYTENLQLQNTEKSMQPKMRISPFN